MVGDTPYMAFKHWWHAFRIMYDMQAHAWSSSIFRSKPAWTYHIGLEAKHLERLLQLVERNELRVVLDSLHAFDASSVQKAFEIQKSRHAHGKVAIRVSDA
ncbi:unnamed protein product [Durusdinium trenchii]|uniref:Uncharacterized protein n=1 Tax=Durusdinium trenchii TaxID=1381693 RepID=A0ABP0SF59_9DINO